MYTEYEDSVKENIIAKKDLQQRFGSPATGANSSVELHCAHCARKRRGPHQYFALDGLESHLRQT